VALACQRSWEGKQCLWSTGDLEMVIGDGFEIVNNLVMPRVADHVKDDAREGREEKGGAGVGQWRGVEEGREQN